MVFLEALQYSFFIQALLAAILVMGAMSLASTTIVANQQSYLTQGISQAMVFGVAAAGGNTVYGLGGAISAALLAAYLIHSLRKRKWLPADATIAIISSLFFALGVLVISSTGSRDVQVSSILFGNILGVSQTELILLASLATASIAFFGAFGNKLVYAAQNSESATASGINVDRLGTARMTALALLTALSVPVVGVILVVAAAVLPAVIGFTLSPRIRIALLLGISSSIIAAIVGLFASYSANTPTGPTIIITLTALWGAALLASRFRRPIHSKA